MNAHSLALLKQAVLKNRPVLGQILEKDGQKPLAEYAGSYADTAYDVSREKKQQLISVVVGRVFELFGSEKAESIGRQLEKSYFASTADHHGPLVHPFFLGSNLLVAAAGDSFGLENVLVLACGNVSLGNSSYPRGLLVHRSAKAWYRLPLVPSVWRQSAVFRHPAFTKSDLLRLEQKLANDRQSALLQESGFAGVLGLLRELYDSSAVLDQDYYSDQISLTNYHLWRKFFPPRQPRVPDLIYLQMEDIVIRLLLDYHLSASTEISSLFFDSKTRAAVERHFSGIPGAFTADKQTGTFLFWFLPPGGRHRLQLWPQGDVLAAADGSYKVALNSQALAAALKRGELIPNTMLSLLVLSAYHGLKCLGGFSQVQYLTSLHQAYAKLFGLSLPPSHGQGLCADFMAAFVRSGDALIPATGLDLALGRSEDAWKNFKLTTAGLTLEESLLPMFPEFYKMLYPHNRQDSALTGITPEEIVDFLNLESKIFSVGDLI